MIYSIALTLALASVAAAVGTIKFPLKKLDDHEFVSGILSRAAKGHKLSANVASDGSIVINGN